jgi:hypothetical protein
VLAKADENYREALVIEQKLAPGSEGVARALYDIGRVAVGDTNM